MRKYNVPVVVAINQFGTDTDEELKYIEEYCISKGADFALSNVFGKGGEGGVELANKVVEACESRMHLNRSIHSTSHSRKKLKRLRRKSTVRQR